MEKIISNSKSYLRKKNNYSSRMKLVDFGLMKI